MGIIPLTQLNPLPHVNQLPIYPTESPKLEVVDAPTQLEQTIRETREKATETYLTGRSHLQLVVDRWIGIEHAVECASPTPEPKLTLSTFK